TGCAPERIQFKGQSRSGRFCPFELIALPLHETDGIHGALGLIRPLEAPFWLGADPIISNSPCPDELFAGDTARLPAHETAPHVSDTAAITQRRIRHLLVINGGKR